MSPKSLHKISHGLYVTDARKDEKIKGHTAKALFQIIPKPPTVALSISKENYIPELLKAGRSLNNKEHNII